MTKLTIGIVLYRAGRWIPSLAESLRRNRRDDIEVVILAQESGALSGADELTRLCPWIRVAWTSENLGYSGGHQLLFSGRETPWYLALNFDLEIGAGVIPSLLGEAERRPDGGAFAPLLLRLRDGEGDEEVDSAGLERLAGMRFRERGAGRAPDELWPAGRPEAEVVWGLSGAALLVRREAVTGGELFDPSFWMYFEDVDLALRLREAGWQSYLLPQIEIRHARGVAADTRRTERPAVLRRSALRNWLRLVRREWGSMLHSERGATLAVLAARFIRAILAERDTLGVFFERR